MHLRLQELQETDSSAQEIRAIQLQKDWEEVDERLYHQELPYIPKIVCSELISRHQNDLFASHFGVNKIKKLIGQKYYWPSLRKDVESYLKGCNVCLASKAVRHKLYGDLQSLFIPTHWWKNFLIHFVIRLPISTNWKSDSYDSILVIIKSTHKNGILQASHGHYQCSGASWSYPGRNSLTPRSARLNCV